MGPGFLTCYLRRLHANLGDTAVKIGLVEVGFGVPCIAVVI